MEPSSSRRRPHHQQRTSQSSTDRTHSKPRAEHQRPDGYPIEQIIMGRNCVREVLRHVPQRLLKVLIAQSRTEHHGREKEELAAAVQAAHIAVQFVPQDELTTIAGSDSHQGVVALMRPSVRRELKEFLTQQTDEQRSTLLMLDAINDPQNLGAILRAAECFDVDAVITGRNRGSPLTPVARKASVGASELVEIVEVNNLADALGKCKDAGYWVVAADATPEATLLSEFEFPERTLLVLGSEGEGIQPLLKKNADFTVKIPLFGRIESLNVSQAAAVMLAQVKNRKG